MTSVPSSRQEGSSFAFHIAVEAEVQVYAKGKDDLIDRRRLDFARKGGSVFLTDLTGLSNRSKFA